MQETPKTSVALRTANQHLETRTVKGRGSSEEQATLSEPIANLVARPGDVKRVAILSRNDLYPLSLAAEIEKSAKKRGMEVVFFEKYAIGALDHASALTQLRAANPDWVVVTGYINDLIVIRKQAGDLRLAPKAFTGINGPAYPEWIRATGPLA